MNKYTLNIATLLSYLFHPLLMPSLGVLLIFNSGTYLSLIPYEGKMLLFTVVFTGTFLIPICFLPLYLYFKVIRNVHMHTSHERVMPLLITLVLFVSTFYILRNMPIPFINMFMLSSAVLILINLIVVKYFMISAHLLGLGGITGLLLGLTFRLHANIPELLILSVFCSGMVASARLVTQSHRPVEVYVGYLTGLALVGGSLIYA